jgi:hypothetical protein
MDVNLAENVVITYNIAVLMYVCPVMACFVCVCVCV